VLRYALTKLVDVESVEARSKASDLGMDLHVLSFDLRELDESRDTGSTVFSEDADCVVSVSDHDFKIIISHSCFFFLARLLAFLLSFCSSPPMGAPKTVGSSGSCLKAFFVSVLAVIPAYAPFSSFFGPWSTVPDISSFMSCEKAVD